MRGVRKQLANAIWLGVMIACGLLVGGYILAHQRVNWPTWTPGLGKEYFTLNAEFTNSAGVLPGQGNAVTVAGVKVGEITGEEVRNGRAVLELRIDEQHGKVHPDATVLLRPKTALKDMVAELDPARRGKLLHSGDTLPDQLDQLPTSTSTRSWPASTATRRAALVALLQGARHGARWRGRTRAGRHVQALRAALAPRRGGPAARRQAARQAAPPDGQPVAAGRKSSVRATRNLGQFVNSSAAVFRRFTAQNDKLGETLSLLPGALKKTNVALGKLDTLGTTFKTRAPGSRTRREGARADAARHAAVLQGDDAGAPRLDPPVRT